MDAMTLDCPYDRAAESLGNVVELQHVNVRVPDQQKATAFYISALGLTRDPYLMTGTDNMWANVGLSQFHLPTGVPEVVRGTTALILPNRAGLLERLHRAKRELEGTRYAFTESNDGVETVCPWGNRIRVHEPDAGRFGRVVLGMPYVEFDVAPGTTPGIARFYREILDAPATAEGGTARALVANGQYLVFKETDAPQPEFDGHHIQISLADFGGPHARLRERGLISEESNPWQYRFLDIVDLDTNRPLFRVEHEVRSMTHPLFARPLVNRNAAINNRNYMPGHEAGMVAMPPE
ncbi:MAG: VOC family protein [Acetobacteraceae bacterium]|nr:VOC family protein [Acetobacteraceae bacterium]